MNGSVIVSTKSCSNAHEGAALEPPQRNLPQTPTNGNSTMTSGNVRMSEVSRNSVNNTSRSQTSAPPADQGYDVTRMREDEFERLAVYIVPDVACERGVPNRADQTLPRSLTLKASLVLSTPNATVSFRILASLSKILISILKFTRLKECGALASSRKELDLGLSREFLHQTFPQIRDLGNISGG